jgi:predicted RNA-binding protein YlxR (DUF448 family)
VGCRQARPKDELVRIVRRADGVVVVDASGAAPGRGAYLCGEPSCLERGLRRERLAHAFRKPSRPAADLGTMIATMVNARRTSARVPVE